MPTTNLSRAALLMLFLVSIAIISWEIHLRNKGVQIDYDDGPALWSYQREQVYQPKENATVFIGSSRIKYDLDVDVWKNITGDVPVQLAIEGSCPLPVLDNLADDKNFKGKLIVDVTEGLFFSGGGHNNAEPIENVKHYKELTPAQRAGFRINQLLESELVFLDKGNYSLSAVLDKLEIPSRRGVFMMPIFPMEFGRVNFQRQSSMTDKFLADTNLQVKVRNIWLFFRSLSKEAPPMPDHVLDSIMQSVKIATSKIRARGGDVLFVRTPSSGPFWKGEQMGFPREKYWGRLLQLTGCPGIHFADYPAIDHFVCPDWSHLSPGDATVFTMEFIRILNGEKKWSFPKLAAQ